MYGRALVIRYLVMRAGSRLLQVLQGLAVVAGSKPQTAVSRR